MYSLLILFVQIVNDDEAERARRRSCLELQKRVSNIGTLHRSATPVSVTGNASDSESCAISEASLEDHYQTCLKLFTENVSYFISPTFVVKQF